MIAWEQSRAASGYEIIWGGGDLIWGGGTQIETNKRDLVRNVIAWIGFNRTTDQIAIRSRLLF